MATVRPARAAVLTLAVAAAVGIRMFSVYRYGPMLSKMSGYENLRATEHLSTQGLGGFLDWFDDKTWFPHGASIGRSTHPGLMMITSVTHKISSIFVPTLEILDVAVYLAPIAAGLSALIGYLIATELKNSFAGLACALIIAVVPGFVASSVAGSFDGDSVVTPLTLITYYCWVKAMKSTSKFSQFWAVAAALSYFTVAATWTHYGVVHHIISAHVLLLLLLGEYERDFNKVYVTFYVLANTMIMQIAPIGPAVVFSSKFYFSHSVFVLAQIVAVSSVTAGQKKQSWITSALGWVGIMLTAIIVMLTTHMCVSALLYSELPAWSVGVVALITNKPTDIESQFNSAADQQPSAWASFYYDMHILMILLPFGIYKLLQEHNRQTLFLVVCALFSLAFAGLNVKGMATLSVPASIVSAIALASIMPAHLTNVLPDGSDKSKKQRSVAGTNTLQNRVVSWAVLACVGWMCISFANHSVWVASEAYSSPSIILTSKNSDGSRYILDDFRQSYSWIKNNTPPDSKIMSWWDYGGQIASLANRTVLANSVSGNDEQLSRIAQAFALPESQAYPIVQELGADYVVVVFGGYVGHSSDDLNKFTWMLRIASSTRQGEHIKESDYYSARGIFRVDKGGTTAMTESLLYKLSYFRFDTVYTDSGQPKGFDRVRRAAVGNNGFVLKTMEEVYTSPHWLVRVYKVKALHNRGLR
eukprot:m.133163 g.133163  ORF g.133163 m.133163 type:complete len:701 (-) comp29659_c0_seq1:131-2233(-)